MKYLKFFFYKINKKTKIGKNLKAGRNFTGNICVQHKSGGIKSKNYNIDWYRRIELYGYVYKIISSSSRTAFIGSIIYENGLFSNIILTNNINIGDKIYSGILNTKSKIGYTNLLNNINLFSIINNVESYTNQGFSISRSAGTYALLTNKNKQIVTIKLKSGHNLRLPIRNLASYGQVSNIMHKFNNILKAGNLWNLGKRPSVRGVAMNPCDHPHGGGEGRKSPPKAQKSPWGWLTKGTPTIKKKYKKKLIKIKKIN